MQNSWRFFFLFYLLLWSGWEQGYAQNKALDSLQGVLAQLKEDTSRVRTLNLLSQQYQETNALEALRYAEQALKLGQKLRFVHGEAQANVNLGWIYYRRNILEKAIEYTQAALAQSISLGDLLLEAQVLTNLGALYNEQGNYKKSLDYFDKSLGIFQKLNHHQGVGRCLNNLAFTHFKAKQYTLAADFVRRSLRHNTDNAYYRAFALRTQGDIAYAQQQYTPAIEAWKATLTLADSIQNNSLKVATLNRMAEVYIAQSQENKAVNVLQMAVALGQQFGYRAELRQTYALLAKTYKQQGNYEQGLAWQERFFALHDSIFNEKNAEKINTLAALFENEQKEKEILLLKTQANEQDKKNQQRGWLLLATLLLVAFVSTIALLTQRSRQKLQKINASLTKAKDEITEKNEEINQQKEELVQTLELIEQQRVDLLRKNEDVLASINYALQIQQAVLPTEQEFAQAFGKEGYFIFYKPRDIVSGDFYFLENIQQQDTNITLLAVADCTGHGVPGAFMSMIGSQILTETVGKEHIVDPAAVLNSLQSRIRQALHQERSLSRDGMDICIVTCYQREDYLRIDFAGAMNPLFVIRQEGKLEKIRPDRMPVGGGVHYKPVPYQTQTLYEGTAQALAQEPITLYLCTDGYQDQFGGTAKRRLMMTGLKSLLESIALWPLPSQKQKLEQHLQQWRAQGQEPQIDDITIVGVKFGGTANRIH
jgi:serine phosphatase RsbU (regulator of sigma subunit)